MRNTGQTGGTAGADIRATNAWDLFTGDPNLLLGVIDTGIDYNHPDLAANAWTDALEAAGTTGVDDDGNGYVDDIHGYDFVNNDGDPMDDNGHGSPCSGTIGGVGNNGVGGPDAVGYRWVDSDEVGGAAFSWVDITGVGTLVTTTGDDAISGPQNLGFSFPFYGNSFASLRVCTNGLASFTDLATPYSNGRLPTTGGAANMLAPFWDDLDFGGPPRVYVHNDGSRYIVSWIGAPHYQTGGPYSFQILLYPSGEIRYQYLTMGSPTNSATVGIQNAAESVGLTVAYNTTYLHDALAGGRAALHGRRAGRRPVHVPGDPPPERPHRVPVPGHDAAQELGDGRHPERGARHRPHVHVQHRLRARRDGGAVLVRARVAVGAAGGGFDPARRHDGRDGGDDADGLDYGQHEGNLRLSSNDPDEGVIDVPVTLYVDNLVAVDPLVPTSYGLRLAGANPARGGTATLQLALPVAGAAEVLVYDVRGALVVAGKYYVSARTAGGTYRTDVVLLK